MVPVITPLSLLNVGGGIDCFLSAKRVGPSGKVYGLDMTEDMIRLAIRNAEEAGITNVEFLLGTMESIPLPDESIDVLISNCVINLAENKDVVLREAYRVLKRGGKLAVSDIVVKADLPTSVLENMNLWTGCIAGALNEQEYAMKLRKVGFKEVEIEEVRVYTKSDVWNPINILQFNSLQFEEMANQIRPAVRLRQTR